MTGSEFVGNVIEHKVTSHLITSTHLTVSSTLPNCDFYYAHSNLRLFSNSKSYDIFYYEVLFFPITLS